MTTDPRQLVDDSARYIDAAIDPKNNYFVPVWDAVLKVVPTWNVLLDVGCGNGVFADYAKRMTGCALWGLDGDPEVLEWAARLDRFERLASVQDFNSDMLPIEDAACDFVLSKDLLEHLLRPEHVVAEVHRVLAPGGHFLVHVPNHFPLHGRVKFLLTNNLDTYGYFPGSELWSFPHVRFFTYESLCRLLAANGLTPILDLSWNFSMAPYLPLPASMRRALAVRWPSQWAGGFSVLCRKS